MSTETKNFEDWRAGGEQGALLLCGDSMKVLRGLPTASVEAVVCDPPYGLGDTSPETVADCLSAWASGREWTPKGKGFMGKSWDAWVPPPALWREVLRVLKPGGHALVFAGSRTQDLMGISLRLAGFEVRDTLMWLYGSGFPKSHDISKQIDKNNNSLLVVGQGRAGKNALGQDIGFNKTYDPHTYNITRPNCTDAKTWAGWGTALKPAYEPIILARKPLEGTVAQNTLKQGCGGLNIDDCRVGEEGGSEQAEYPKKPDGTEDRASGCARTGHAVLDINGGRWPSNILLDEHAAEALDAQTGGHVSRFFYTAKASRAEREAGLEGLPLKAPAALSGEETRPDRPTNHPMRANHHPTVKPIDLMRYLVKLITPPDGVVLDPFMGSGTTGCAALLEGKRFVGVEMEAEYHQIAEARIKHWGGKVVPRATAPAQGQGARQRQANSEGLDAEQLDLFAFTDDE